MKRCKSQRERYLSKALELHRLGMGYHRISRIIPVPEGTIQGWIIKFADDNRGNFMVKKKASQSGVPEEGATDVASIRRILQETRAELRRERMKSALYEKMIDVAEARFNIRIRKKAGAKQ